MKIEKGIPLAKISGVVGRSTKYPFGEMDIGDSILLNSEVEKKARAAAVAYGRVHGIKFASRTTPEGLRIWRIA